MPSFEILLTRNAGRRLIVELRQEAGFKISKAGHVRSNGQRPRFSRGGPMFAPAADGCKPSLASAK